VEAGEVADVIAVTADPPEDIANRRRLGATGGAVERGPER